VGVEVAVTLTLVRLLPGCSVSISTLAAANKVFIRVSGTSIVGSATNTTIDPTWADSPREMAQTINAGDLAAANAVAGLVLIAYQPGRTAIAGLKVPIRWGLGIRRGQLLMVTIPRAGILGQSFPVRRLEHDFAANTTTIDVGDFSIPRDEMEAHIKLALALAKLKKETT
jgi:hypothetical protein